MSTEGFLARTTFNNLEASIELALSQTEGFRDEAENFADLARRGIRLVGVVANLSSFPANPEDGDAVLVESETQIYFWDATSSTWKNSQIIGSAIWGNVQGTLADQSDLQTALGGKADINPTKNKSFIFTESDFNGAFLDTEQIRIRLKNGSRSFDFFDFTFAGWRVTNTTSHQIAINAKIIAGVTTTNTLYLPDMNESVNVIHSFGTVDVVVQAVGSNNEFDIILTFDTPAGDLNNYTLELRATASNPSLELIEAVKETA